MMGMHEQIAGTCWITTVAPAPGLSVQVRIIHHGWREQTTLLCFRLVDPGAQALVERAVIVVPESDAHVSRHLLRVRAHVLGLHPMWGPLLEIGQAVCLRWRIELRDAAGRVLVRKTFENEYSALR